MNREAGGFVNNAVRNNLLKFENICHSILEYLNNKVGFKVKKFPLKSIVISIFRKNGTAKLL